VYPHRLKKKMDNLGDDQIIVLLEGDISDLDIEFSDDENDVQVNNLDYPSVDWNVDFNASLGDNFENKNDLEQLERNDNQLYFEQILPQEQSYFSEMMMLKFLYLFVIINIENYYLNELNKTLTLLTLILTIVLHVTRTI